MPAVENKYRVKLVTKFGQDTDVHYWHCADETGVAEIVRMLDDWLPETGVSYAIYTYIDTPLGHIRIR
jgi:hypothetical protein